MTPNLHSCSPKIFSCPPYFAFLQSDFIFFDPKSIFSHHDFAFFFPENTFLQSGLTFLLPDFTVLLPVNKLCDPQNHIDLHNYRNNKTQLYTTNGQPLTHAYVHWLADVHSVGFAPAFTLSFHDSERSSKWNIPCNGYRQMPITSAVIWHSRK